VRMFADHGFWFSMRDGNWGKAAGSAGITIDWLEYGVAFDDDQMTTMFQSMRQGKQRLQTYGSDHFLALFL
jgi:hypothetical protein